jgi:uroporphyrinogen-III decarboxylase
MVIGVAERLVQALPQADVRVPVAGPFSIAVSLRGITGLCEDLALEPAKVARWLLELAENQADFCRAVVAAGLDVAFFESAAAPPLMSPRQFRDIELPALRRVVALAAGIARHPVPCIMGGDTLPIVDELLSTGTGFLVCNVETDQAQFVRRVSRTHPHVRIRVNMDPAIVAGTDADAITREVDRILTLAAGYPNCLMGTGCLPLETPPDNVRRIAAYVA